MLSIDEKAAFAERLSQAINRSQKRQLNATELSTQFNLRHPNEPVSPQAAQKWLTGKAKPTADKLKTLSEWLDVPLHWLSYGAPEPFTKKSAANRQHLVASQAARLDELSPDEQKLIGKYRRLNGRQQHLVYEIAETLSLEREIHQQE